MNRRSLLIALLSVAVIGMVSCSKKEEAQPPQAGMGADTTMVDTTAHDTGAVADTTVGK